MRLVGALTDAEMSSGRGEPVADNSKPTQSHPQQDEAFFAPRLNELPGLVPSLPGAPGAISTDAR
jgi:hypothetical protein